MDIALLIEHTLLKADTTLQDAKRICQEAIDYKLGAICIPPQFVKEVAQLSEGRVKIVSVTGFPMGYSAIPAKVEEIKRAIDDGVDELDIVVNIAAIKSAQWHHVRNDIDVCTRAVQLKGKVVKWILETSLLTPDELKQVCDLCNSAEPDFVKTSTGFHGGADVNTVQLLRRMMKEDIRIKASGGIRTREAAEALIAAGANRIGTSSSLQIISK